MAGATADSSEGVLAITNAGVSADAPRVVGPGLTIGMSETQVITRLNAWGIARDAALRELRDNLVQTQTVLSATFQPARAAFLATVLDSRAHPDPPPPTPTPLTPPRPLARRLVPTPR